MEQHPYWHKQTSEKPLYPDVEWNKPQQKTQAGRLGIIGGNKLGFISVAEAYSTALRMGVGEVRIVLPDALKKSIPPSITDAIFAPTTPSGSLAKNAKAELQALAEWSTGLLLIGDAGRNSETAILYEQFVQSFTGQLVITRDAVDLLKNASASVIERPHTLLVVSFAQLQKLFQAIYYPKILTFSMQLTQLVEALHKFTITYPVTITTFHADQLIVAASGEVVTTPWSEPMAIWKGDVATKAAAYWLWNDTKPLEAIASSFLK